MAHRLPMQLKIPRRHHKCQVGGETFEPGSSYHSILFEASNDEFERKDICIKCSEESQDHLEGACTHWFSQIPEKHELDARGKSQVERSMTYLQQCMEDSQDEKALLVAMLLTRRKVLKLCQELTKDNGETFLLYEVVETEEILPVKKVDLSSVNLDQMQNELTEALKDATDD